MAGIKFIFPIHHSVSDVQVVLTVLMKILFPCRHPAPDVTLGLVRVQHLAGLAGKGRVDLEETFRDVWWCQVRNKKNCISFDCLRN